MSASHCVIIPFLDRFDMLADCLQALEPALLDDTLILLIDDGSSASPASDQALAPWLQRANVTLLQHDHNRGVAASRNTALYWCRQQDITLAIMLDSDCLPAADFVRLHLQLHEQHRDAVCIGGAIVGVGEGFWARLDNVTSWIHAMPHGKLREVRHPYHLPTTNFSTQVKRLPLREQVFDERLMTGEDALLIRELRHKLPRVLFSPEPVVRHRDRETLWGVLKHHYDWGHHQYFVQLGKDFTRPVFRWWYRLPFTLAFAIAMPLYALMGSALNLAPWIRHKPQYLAYFPLVYLLWLAKSLALLSTGLSPNRYLRKRRMHIANTFTVWKA